MVIENEIIDPVTGLRIESKVKEILPIPLDPDTIISVPKTRQESIESSRIGPDGVQQLFPDMAGGTEWYMPIGLGVDTITDGNFYKINYTNVFYNNNDNKSGFRYKFDIYPHGNMGLNLTKFSYKTTPKPSDLGGNEKGLRNHELTCFIKTGSMVGDYQSCIFRLQGREEPAIRSALEIGYPTNSYPDTIVNVAYSLSPIVKVNNIQQYISGDRLTTPNKWTGIKIVYIVAEDDSWVWIGMYVDLNPIDDYNNPRNNWRLKSECIFAGVKEYGMIIPSWRGWMDSIIVDGYENVELKYISDREIDVKGFKPLHSITNPQMFKIAMIAPFNPEYYNTLEDIEQATEV